MSGPIELVASDGYRLSGYEAKPLGACVGGLVVLQEIFGVNKHIRSVCDRFAAQGFHVIAPSLFDRVRPGIELGYSDSELQEGRNTRLQIAWEDTIRDVVTAQAALDQKRRTAVIGYCWGGSVAWLAATRLGGIRAAVCYYGAQIAPEFVDAQPRCPVLMHFADDDPWIPATDVEKIRHAQGETVTIHVYHASHGFNCDERANYHAPSAALASQRTLEFLQQSLTLS
jgi:carboxymethylenebutenolidase